MGAVVYGVDRGEGSRGVSEFDDDLDGIDRADGVRRIANGDELGALVNFRCEVGDVERAVFVVNLGPADSHAAIFGHLQPRGNVGVVIETGDEDFVSGIEFTADGTGHRIRQARHVRSEDDFVGAAVQKVGHRATRLGNHGVGVTAGRVSSASVGVIAAQVVGNGVDDALRNLRPARAVKERGRMAVDGLGEGRELGANVLNVEGSGEGFREWHDISISIMARNVL